MVVVAESRRSLKFFFFCYHELVYGQKKGGVAESKSASGRTTSKSSAKRNKKPLAKSQNRYGGIGVYDVLC